MLARKYKIRRAVATVICVILVAGIGVGLAFIAIGVIKKVRTEETKINIQESVKTSVGICPDEYAREKFTLSKGDSYGTVFQAAIPFDGLKITVGECEEVTLTLRKMNEDGTYGSSVASATFESVKKESEISLSFEEQKEGKYIVLLTTSSSANIYTSLPTVPCKSLINSVENSSALPVTVFFSRSGTKYFAEP